MFFNSDVYCGDFFGVFFYGKGIYIWLDGIIYEGVWDEGKMIGKG